MVLDPESLARTWRRYRETRRREDRDALVLAYAGLVKVVAGRLAIGLPAHVDAAELFGYGVFGLLEAIERFDPERGVKFETFAVPRIRGAMLDGLRSMDWVPTSLRQRGRQIEEAFWRLETELGRPPDEAEVAVALGLSAREVRHVIREMARSQVLSLDELWPLAEGDDGEFALRELVQDTGAEDPFAAATLSELRRALAEAIDRLPARERLIVSLYYFEGLTAKEIAGILRLSISRISQLHSRALARLRGHLRHYREGLVEPRLQR
ncbi:MAG: FliA/WhiG family RNA polymerase sigma factor [Clostridia bacterium]|nr:FliA/WhiG family RNA polymerase sigma factor [Clostridia bacterium]